MFYNGYVPQLDVVMREGGHAKNSIHNLKSGIFTRGILIDIPRLKGVPYLEPGTPIYAEDLEAWEKKAGIKVSPDMSAPDSWNMSATRTWEKEAGKGNLKLHGPSGPSFVDTRRSCGVFHPSPRAARGRRPIAQCAGDMPLYTNFCARLFPSSLTSAV